MDQAGALVNLCEAYWQGLSDGSRIDLSTHTQKFMQYLGWDRWESIETDAAEATVVVRGHEGTSLAAYFVRPGALEPPSRQVARGLDFCACTLELARDASARAVDYMLVTDLYRSYLYDAATDELLLFSDAPKLFLTEIYDEVTKECVDEGALSELRRPPRSSLSRQLRDWQARWSEAIANEPGSSEELADHLMDRLTVFRFLLDANVPHQAVESVRQRLQALLRLSSPDAARSGGQALLRLFGEVYGRFKAELFRPDPARDTPLERSPFIGPLMEELLLLSKAKFTIPTILESFNYGDAAEKARVRIVPEEDADREKYLAEQTLETIDETNLEIDVLEEGYRAIGHWLEKLVSLYDRLNVAQNAGRAGRGAQDGDLDLWSWSATDADRPAALRDPYRHSIERGLRVFYAEARQYRIARLMLYLYFIQMLGHSGIAIGTFPQIESALARRPALLESEKRWIYQPPPDDASRGWDVV